MKQQWFWNLFFGFLKIFGFEIFLNHQKLLEAKQKLLENILFHLEKNKINKVILICLEESGYPTYDFLREKISVEIIAAPDTIRVSGYKKTTTSKGFEIKKGLSVQTIFVYYQLCGKNQRVIFLLVDDMIDSGGSAKEVEKYFRSRQINDTVFCPLLDKNAGRRIFTPTDLICGTKIKTVKFLYGNGSDLNGSLREIKFVFGFHKWAHDWIFKHWPIRPVFGWLIEKYDRLMIKSIEKDSKETLCSVPIS